jgi:uncharacterized protein (TIGR03435 family)
VNTTTSLTIAIATGLPLQVLAQPLAEARPAFEVTSVKVNASGSPKAFKNPFVFSPARFAATNVTLEDVLLVAYNTTRIQIQGGPNWIDSERFDIEAVGTVKRGQMLPMIQNLLVDRFSLAVHRETKDMPAYVLVIGKSGHKLRPAKEGEITRHMPDPGGPVTFERMAMSGFAMFLSSAVVQPVIDRTGLAGFFDFTLDLTPDPSQLRPPGADASPFPADVYNARIDLVRSAVQEQLGLRLEMQKAPIEVIMIDRVQRPTEN